MSTRELNATITRRVDVSPGLWIIDVSPDGWKLADFEAGQYTTLGLPGLVGRYDRFADKESKAPDGFVRRVYSIASSPNERNHLEFYLVRIEDGGLTPPLFDCQLGDRLWLAEKITGTFVLSRVPQDVNLVFIATGTGIAPFISMLRTILVAGSTRRIAALHGVRASRDLGYDAELKEKHERHEHFTYVPIISRPDNEPHPWHGRVGYVQDIWRSRLLDDLWGFSVRPENTHVFLCGSPAMIDENLDVFGVDGFMPHTRHRPGHVHCERYW